jgi:hypothetical protein
VPSVSLHPFSKAAFAAETAESISSWTAAEIVARSLPLAGLDVSRVLPLRDGTNSLLMKRPVGTLAISLLQLRFLNV